MFLYVQIHSFGVSRLATSLDGYRSDDRCHHRQNRSFCAFSANIRQINGKRCLPLSTYFYLPSPHLRRPPVHCLRRMNSNVSRFSHYTFIIAPPRVTRRHYFLSSRRRYSQTLPLCDQNWSNIAMKSSCEVSHTAYVFFPAGEKWISCEGSLRPYITPHPFLPPQHSANGGPPCASPSNRHSPELEW